MKAFRIAVIPGDGIGKEVVPEGLRVLEKAAGRFDLALAFDHFEFASCDYYLKHGAMLPDDWKGRSAGTTRSSTAPSAGRRRCPITSRSGVP